RTELIHGVTGSGKTLIYAHLIARMLAQGRQILFLVPEIALAQTLSDRFGMLLAHDDVESPILMWHGGLAMGRRSHVWRRVQSGAPLLLVGVRSASLLPMPNLGLVVVDEEHDHSFKQDEAPHYHARDIAIKRAQQADVAVVLGSATPSMESLVRSQQQRRHHRLTMRAMGHEPVRPEMIDLRHVPVEPGHCLAPPMVAAVGEHLARG
ncbi:MAG TPA: primosomal protein N', partial [Alphaproteobacteria bacterium]|nr:primosomal protein N' [Alphaproteobacteria bacterium]